MFYDTESMAVLEEYRFGDLSDQLEIDTRFLKYAPERFFQLLAGFNVPARDRMKILFSVIFILPYEEPFVADAYLEQYMKLFLYARSKYRSMPPSTDLKKKEEELIEEWSRIARVYYQKL